MTFWSRIRYSRIENSIYQCKRRYSQVHGFSSSNHIIGLTRIRVLENPNNSFSFQKRSELYGVVRYFAAPVQVKPKQESKEQKGACLLNDQITAQFVRLVTDDSHAVVSRYEALDRAKKLKLDLVEVDRNAKPPVCKIMDYHLEKYKQQVKGKEKVKSKPEGTLRKGDCKEVRFSGKCEPKDLKMKADTAKRMMEKGYRVKCMAMGTESEDLGALLSRLSALIEDVAIVESGPRVEKKQAFMVVRHIKFGLPKKSGKVKVAKAPKDTIEQAATNNSGSIQCPIQSEQDSVDTESEAESEIESELETEEAFVAEKAGKEAWAAVDASPDFESVFDIGREIKPSSATREMKSEPPFQHGPSHEDDINYNGRNDPRNRYQPTRQVERSPDYRKPSSEPNKYSFSLPRPSHEGETKYNGRNEPRNGFQPTRQFERTLNGAEVSPEPNKFSQYVPRPSRGVETKYMERNEPRNGFQPARQFERTPNGPNLSGPNKFSDSIPRNDINKAPFARAGYESQNQRSQPLRPEPPMFRNLKPPAANEGPKPEQSRPQTPPTPPPPPPPPSYGIFSASKHATPSKNNTGIDTDPFDPSRRGANRSNAIPDGNPPNPGTDSSQRPESENTSKPKFGIFSR